MTLSYLSARRKGSTCADPIDRYSRLVPRKFDRLPISSWRTRLVTWTFRPNSKEILRLKITNMITLTKLEKILRLRIIKLEKHEILVTGPCRTWKFDRLPISNFLKNHFCFENKKVSPTTNFKLSKSCAPTRRQLIKLNLIKSWNW